MPVTLTEDSGATRYRIAGWLCQPDKPTDTVQVLIAGLTYSHRYWTGFSRHTSYVDAARAAGNAVYLIDRIGIGASDRPPAAQVTLGAQATINHQIVQALRTGPLGHYHRVVGIGHSYGSAIWIAEAAHYRDVDALVLTGLLQQNNPEALTAFTRTLYPAVDDPAFPAGTTPDGYLTTRPGTRSASFLYPPGVVPGAPAWDERTKATATTGELTFSPPDENSTTHQVYVPVLLVIGTHDTLFCSDTLRCRSGRQVWQREHPFYPADTPLYAAVIPASGHSINLHRTAAIEFCIANRWINGVLPALNRRAAPEHPDPRLADPIPRDRQRPDVATRTAQGATVPGIFGGRRQAEPRL